MRYKYLFLILSCILLAACGIPNQDVFKDDDDFFVLPPPTLPPERPPLPTESPWHDAIPEGYVPSRLTGLFIPPEYANARPIAVVINNMYKALPQSGVSQADIVYEVLAEGDITRLICIFQAHELEKIGPVRSARDYFIDFALDYDAVFVHHGGSPLAYERLYSLNINRMDGMNLEGNCFRRERFYPEWYAFNSGTRPMEHSSYTNSEGLRAVMESRNMRTELSEERPFGFIVSPGSDYRRVDTAESITVPFSPNYTRRFIYDTDTALYTAHNRDGAHVDAETQEAVQVRNIIIQLVKTHVIAGDSEGRRHVQTIGEGSGYLVRDGFYERITWVKASHTDPIRWYYLDGAPINLSVGRTWVCVFQENGKINFGNEIEDE